MRKTILGSALCYLILLLALAALLLTSGSFWALAGLCLPGHSGKTHGSQLSGAYPQRSVSARNALWLSGRCPQ